MKNLLKYFRTTPKEKLKSDLGEYVLSPIVLLCTVTALIYFLKILIIITQP